MKKQVKIVVFTLLALILTSFGSIVGYSAFPEIQSQILFLLIVFSAWTSVLALFWALYGILNFYNEVDKAKSKIHTAKQEIPPFLTSVGEKLLEFQRYWDNLDLNQREALKEGVMTVLDLLEAKIKQLSKRGW